MIRLLPLPLIQHPITGTLAATESGADAAAVAGKVGVAGSIAATETGSDVAALSGDPIVSGALAGQESGSDTAAAAGGVVVVGALAGQEEGQDQAAAEGEVAAAEVTGQMAAQEAGQDVATIVLLAPRLPSQDGGLGGGPGRSGARRGRGNLGAVRMLAQEDAGEWRQPPVPKGAPPSREEIGTPKPLPADVIPLRPDPVVTATGTPGAVLSEHEYDGAEMDAQLMDLLMVLRRRA